MEFFGTLIAVTNVIKNGRSHHAGDLISTCTELKISMYLSIYLLHFLRAYESGMGLIDDLIQFWGVLFATQLPLLYLVSGLSTSRESTL
jgi:hypothetical protein